MGGHDAVALHSAIAAAREERQKPTLICCKTTIGFGAPNAGSEATHGAPLGKDKVAATREALGWHYAPFEIPEKYYSAWDGKAKGQKVEQAWNAKWQAYEAAYPELAVELQRRLQGDLPSDWHFVVVVVAAAVLVAVAVVVSVVVVGDVVVAVAVA